MADQPCTWFNCPFSTEQNKQWVHHVLRHGGVCVLRRRRYALAALSDHSSHRWSRHFTINEALTLSVDRSFLVCIDLKWFWWIELEGSVCVQQAYSWGGGHLPEWGCTLPLVIFKAYKCFVCVCMFGKSAALLTRTKCLLNSLVSDCIYMQSFVRLMQSFEFLVKSDLSPCLHAAEKFK